MNEVVVTTTGIEYTTRPYRGDEDLARVVAIIETCEQVDRLEEGTSIDELREEYGEPGFNPADDVILWETPAGEPVAVAEYHAPFGAPDQLRDPGLFMWFKIIPEARASGIEAQMTAVGIERCRSVAQSLGTAVRLRAVARDTEAMRAAELERLGFAPERYYLRMARPLTGELRRPAWPAGIGMRAGELPDEQYAELHNAIWVDHFAYEPWTAADAAYYRTLGDYDPQLDLVAYNPQGEAVAFCWCSIRDDENRRNRRNDGWIGLLGVRREYRNLGLGAALLREGQQRLRERGADSARLGVDGDSPTGATRLYLAEGFTTVHTRILYAYDLNDM